LRSTYLSDQQKPIWFLIGANVLLFLATLIVPSLQSFLSLRLVNFFHYPWTLITSMFMHGGFWHLFANMLTLFFFGTFLLQLIGARNFLIIYFLGGIIGNIFFLIASLYGIGATPYTGVVGASGAIYTLGGILAVMTPNLRVYIFGLFPVPLWIAVLLGFVIIFPGVAWQAHLGGLLTGLVAGLIFRQRARRYYFWR